MSMARANAYTIVEYSTAYPFRLPESCIMCVFCCELYREPESFRQHMQTTHQVYKPQHAFAHINSGYLKVDITDLRCRICNDDFRNLKDIAYHLKDTHGLQIHTEHEYGLLPFRMEKDRLLCPICEKRLGNMRGLSRHVQSHFFKCICEHCGRAYAASGSLLHHVKYSCIKSSGNNKLNAGNEKKFRCKKCKTMVTSMEEHMKVSEACLQHICYICGERFGYWRQKQKHLVEVHAAPKRSYKCPECDMIFQTSQTLKEHFVISHTEDYMSCIHCGVKFDNKYRLGRHMLTHTGEKAFTCNVCSKRYSRQSTLNQHMWIHSKVKRHECEICGKTFNQKVCWKTHMKTRHPKVDDLLLS